MMVYLDQCKCMASDLRSEQPNWNMSKLVSFWYFGYQHLIVSWGCISSFAPTLFLCKKKKRLQKKRCL